MKASNPKQGIIEKGIKALYTKHPVRMHMPGHKGKKRGYRYDITEVDGADTLQEPEGILLEAQSKLAGYRGAENAYFLVGGSTAGIQAAIFSALKPGDTILVPVNAHYAVYNALALVGANPVLYEPEMIYPGMRVSAEIISRELEKYPETRAVLVTSPDYYGCVSDIEEIARILKKREIPFLLDSAHGAHLKYTSLTDGVAAGADYVIESVHKTLGAPTPGGILYAQGLANPSRVQRALNLFQTSSPSYMLLSGIEKAIDEAEQSGERVFSRIAAAHDALERELEGTPVRLYHPEKQDKSKFVFVLPNAEKAGELLRSEYNIFPEFASGDVLLCMSGIGTSQRDLNRLLGSIKELSSRLDGEVTEPVKMPLPEIVLPIREALFRETERVELPLSLGRLSADFLIPYPPGIPIAVPGSRITENVIKRIQSGHVRGVQNGKVEVIVEET